MKAAVEAPVLNSDKVAKGFADHQFKHPWEEFVEHSGHLHFNGAMVPARWERIKHRNELTVVHNAKKSLCPHRGAHDTTGVGSSISGLPPSAAPLLVSFSYCVVATMGRRRRTNRGNTRRVTN